MVTVSGQPGAHCASRLEQCPVDRAAAGTQAYGQHAGGLAAERDRREHPALLVTQALINGLAQRARKLVPPGALMRQDAKAARKLCPEVPLRLRRFAAAASRSGPS